MGSEIERSRNENARASTTPPLLTDPVDIIEPGTYEFLAGPLPRGATADPGASISFPPDASRHFEQAFPLAAVPTETARNGQRYVTFKLRVVDVAEPYYGLRLWLQ